MRATCMMHKENTTELGGVGDRLVGPIIVSDFVAGVLDGYSTLLVGMMAGGWKKERKR